MNKIAFIDGYFMRKIAIGGGAVDLTEEAAAKLMKLLEMRKTVKNTAGNQLMDMIRGSYKSLPGMASEADAIIAKVMNQKISPTQKIKKINRMLNDLKVKHQQTSRFAEAGGVKAVDAAKKDAGAKAGVKIGEIKKQSAKALADKQRALEQIQAQKQLKIDKLTGELNAANTKATGLEQSLGTSDALSARRLEELKARNAALKETDAKLNSNWNKWGKPAAGVGAGIGGTMLYDQLAG